MAAGFAIRVDTVEPVHHLVGLAVWAERLGAAAVLVGDGGRDLHVAVAAMAVATARVALLPLSSATSSAAARRARPALVALQELSDGRVVGCFPVAALKAGDPIDLPHARIEAGRVASTTGSWRIWTGGSIPDREGPSPRADAIAYRLRRHEVEELAEIAEHAEAAGLVAAMDLLGSTRI